MDGRNIMEWNKYFMSIARLVGTQSKCHSRRIGSVLTRNNRILSTGYNGPPMGVDHCKSPCPRRSKGYESGTRLSACPATHSGANSIISAAYQGVNTKGATLYVYSPIPCKNCAGLIINAGIDRLFYGINERYDELGIRMFLQTGLQFKYQSLEE